MKVAVTHPTAWPWVRRGSERLLNDFSQYLAGRGYAVTVISSSPEGRSETMDGAVRKIFVRQRLSFLKGLRQLNGFHAFTFDCRDAVLRGDYDAVHCLNYHDAYGALLARRASGRHFRIVYQMTGIPVARYFRSIPIDRLMFRRVVRECDAVICLSRFALDCLRRDFGREGLLIPSPTAVGPFEAQPRRLREPRMILFSGDADEPRKGALLLARAFPRIVEGAGALQLHFAGRCSPATQAAILAGMPQALRDKIVFHGIGKVDDLPPLYASAAVVVNPAIWEALGNVLIEALAAGAPVVGANHAGIPDIIDSPRVGALFEPGSTVGAANNVDGLVAAVLAALELSGRPETADLCRDRARDFGWEKLGPRYEAALREVPA